VEQYPRTITIPNHFRCGLCKKHKLWPTQVGKYMHKPGDEVEAVKMLSEMSYVCIDCAFINKLTLR